MTKEKGKNEIIFQLTMNTARKALEQGLITREDYIEFDTKMQQKYSPIFGSLFSDINLQ